MYAETQPPSQQVGPAPIVRRLHTPAGLKYGSYGMLLEIIMAILAVTTLVPLAAVYNPAEWNDPTLAFVAGMGCLIGIMGIVAFIFWILLLYEMYIGKQEFGPKHASRVSRGIVLVILAIILGIVGATVTVIPVFTNFDPSGDPYDIDAAQYRMSTAIGMSVLIVSSIAINLALLFFAVEIIDPEKRNMLWAAFTIAIIAPIAATVITVASLPASGTILSTEVDTLAPWASAAEVFGLIGTALFFLAYRVARQRILDGRIMPTPPPQLSPPQYPPPARGQQSPPTGWGEPPRWEDLEPADEPEK